MAFAASGRVDLGNKLTVGQIEVTAAKDMVRSVVVPLKLENAATEIVAMDIPLSFGQRGDGVDLVNVTYASRVDYFDVKVTNINNDDKTLVMGLIAMATDPNTPDLAPGRGEIAYLKFDITDPTMEVFTIEATTLERPSHRLMLVSHDWSGSTPEVVWEEPEFSHTVNIAASGPVPTTYALHQNYPNPFNAGTVIRFDLRNEGDWDLKVYNLLGQVVRTYNGNGVGNQQVTWNGTDDHGRQVASGVYFYRVQSGKFTETKKMTLLK
jgi:hypothetical protein